MWQLSPLAVISRDGDWVKIPLYPKYTSFLFFFFGEIGANENKEMENVI